MKYLKITSSLIVGTDRLTAEDLVRAKNGSYDIIINRIEETYFDPEENTWKPIVNIDEKKEEYGN